MKAISQVVEDGGCIGKYRIAHLSGMDIAQGKKNSKRANQKEREERNTYAVGLCLLYVSRVEGFACSILTL